MGTYVPSGRRKRRSINEALQEAEQDHFLDCPNADLPIRAAAIVLDAILFWLLWTGIQHTCLSIGAYVNSYLHGAPLSSIEEIKDAVTASHFIAGALRACLVYFFLLWTVARYGGTPAKLLLGLRVGDADTGQRLGITRVLLREIFGKITSTLALGLGWALPLLRDDQRAMHDLLSNSVVKRIHGP